MNTREMQRWTSVAAGGLLAAVGITKGGRNGMLLSLAGAGLAVLGLTRRGHSSHRPGVFDRTQPQAWHVPRERLNDDAKAFGRSRSRRGDAVQEASEESFPASDPPAYTGTTSIGAHDVT